MSQTWHQMSLEITVSVLLLSITLGTEMLELLTKHREDDEHSPGLFRSNRVYRRTEEFLVFPAYFQPYLQYMADWQKSEENQRLPGLQVNL